MTSLLSPLVWPEDFPPKSRWGRFLLGVPWLGPDLSFFKQLAAQQAARTPECMDAWTEPGERRFALALGQCLQKEWGWKTPYFIPADQVLAVIGGPDWWTYFELDLADAFQTIEQELSLKPRAGFWERAVDWDDRNRSFGELIQQLNALKGSDLLPG